MKNLLCAPYSDEILTWDSTTKRYTLTLEQATKLVGYLPYADDGVAEIELKKMSVIIYRWIYAHINKTNRAFVETILNCSEGGRLLLQEAFESQLEADIESGQTDNARQNAINWNSGSVVDRNVIKENQIGIETEEVLDNPEYFVGYNLLTALPLRFTTDYKEVLNSYYGK